MHRILSAAAACVSLAGCATIFTGTTDALTFDANVPNVRLSIDGEYLGELPLTFPMSRGGFVGGRQFLAKFERAGYVTQEFPLKREFNTVAILDITSIPTSGGIDVLTGALIRFSPTGYHVQMLRHGQAASSPEFQRSTALQGFALANHRSLQKDVARGGGEHLATFARALCGGDRAAMARFSEATRGDAPLLLAAESAPDFLARLDRMLADDPVLRPYRP